MPHRSAAHGLDTTSDRRELIRELSDILSGAGLVTKPQAMRPYVKGYRFGEGPALAVAIPSRLVELWRVVNACVRHDVAMIVQAANTGLTGGSTPHGEDYGRPVVVISTLKLDMIHLLGGGAQVVCHAGATLYRLEAKLAPLGRDPHSVIGSSCIGASIVGGVCNNSGGSLIQRGPAFTQYALYARIDADGTVRLVNHLGIDLGDAPEEILERLERGAFSDDCLPEPGRAASDPHYARWVRDVDAPSPARYNADPRRLHEASGCAGKVVVFAVRLDTFPKAQDSRVFYVGTNAPAELTELRRVMLTELTDLPVSAEYMHRGAFDIADRYGKDSFLAIRMLGTKRLPALFRAKDRLARFGERLGLSPGFEERLLQGVARWLPDHLPKRLRQWRDAYAHHLMIRCAGTAVDEARQLLESTFPTATGDWFACDATEAEAAFLHRFVAAGAAIRYRAVHSDTVADIVALDIALRRDDRNWFETLPPEIEKTIIDRLYYGHFFCHVFHQDYLIGNEYDPVAVEHAMWKQLDARGAEYPAEHNVGHLYPAKPALADFYRSLDPGNRLNPGIGQASMRPFYASAEAGEP